jgi:hypothetical protein
MLPQCGLCLVSTARRVFNSQDPAFLDLGQDKRREVVAEMQAGAGTGQEWSRQQLALLRWALLLLIQPVCVVQTHPPAPAKFQVGVSRRAAAPSCWHVETRACCA